MSGRNLIIGAILIAGVVEANAKEYSILVTQAPSAEAQRVFEQLTSNGVKPLAIAQQAELAEVYFGSFASYAETIWYTRQLKKEGYFSARTSDITTAPLQLEPPNAYPNANLFGEALQTTASISYDPRDPRIMPIYNQIKNAPS